MSMNNEAFHALANEIISMSEADQAMRKSDRTWRPTSLVWPSAQSTLSLTDQPAGGLIV